MASKTNSWATGMYNYGYRDYKPEVARFTTVDPIRDGNNWFAYVNNDPVNWVDLWGLEAGEIFPTMDAAAIDFGKEWNGISIDEGVEYGSTIYRSGEGYTYAEPRTDNNPHEVNFALPPGGADEATAGLHTHGNYLNDTDNYFSEYDIDKAKEYGKPSYISTPNGSLIVYDPITDTPRVVTRDLPSDPNDPSSKNYKGSTPGKGK
jgi:RHS repeat-associated protein